ncbi:sigma-E factor negative regulatory protein [Porticoccaceae bacterium]|jgi:sigma-E factor negative regulatory protein RseA|nr:sigma-E factor negative regulatory protein [Porticoccaceae bacterium]MDC0517369.1 sigma-E factor negative regulatory protein [Porticoccaceae bacterium]MDC0589272.1 sigma-E factor negative regulatory protein [Porticoccaceae bacterium]
MSDHKERLDQSLSALMDGEATDMELHRLLKEVSEGSELRDKWKRYHMVSSALKGDAAITPIDYSAAISAAIDEEPSHRQSVLAGFVGSAGRFAIAASVALVAVLGVQQLNSPLDSVAPVSEFAGIEQVDEENVGPAIQFPSGFQPIINARTVSAGGNNKSSQFVTPVIEVRQQAERNYSEAQLRAYMNDVMARHSNHAALNSNQGMLPFARLNEAEAAAEKE